MRKLTMAALATAAAAIAGPALAADMPFYPPVIDIPDVDYGYTGSFYLRGSAGLNAMWAREVNHPTATPSTFAIDDWGYGYSYGLGVGYETGTGLRTDITIDRLHNEGMRTTIPAGTAGLAAGEHRLNLRSTVVLANAYYDMGFGDGYSAAGGLFGYVGAGAGVAFNQMVSTGPGFPDTWGENTSFAAAGMAGLGYDFGAFTTDIGYRALYINRIENATAPAPYSIDNNWVHEVRGTVRYRF